MFMRQSQKRQLLLGNYSVNMSPRQRIQHNNRRAVERGVLHAIHVVQNTQYGVKGQ
jgi:hypothetical protein